MFALRFVLYSATLVRSSGLIFFQLNDGVIPIPGCRNGPGNSCPLSNFTALVEERGDILGSFVDRCGLKSVPNATSTVTFLTDPQPPFIGSCQI